MEGSGTFSIYKYKDAKPGLSIIPVKDIDAIIEKDENHNACSWCGTVVDKNHVTDCSNCGHNDWVKPSKELVKDE